MTATNGSSGVTVQLGIVGLLDVVRRRRGGSSPEVGARRGQVSDFERHEAPVTPRIRSTGDELGYRTLAQRDRRIHHADQVTPADELDRSQRT